MNGKKLIINKKEDTKDNKEIISVRLKKSLIEKIDSISADTNRSRNEVINMCLEFAVNNFGNEEDNI